MIHKIFSVYFLALILSHLLMVSANDWAGANSFFLYALSQADRIAVLDAMKNADMRLLRIFITRVHAGAKGTSAVAINDLETVAVGQYDDTILRRIDQLLVEAHARNIKVMIAMHDRYALGCWETDAYVAKYKLPATGCNGVPDSSTFYLNANAISDFDNRLRHILNFQSPGFGKPWKQLSDVIFSFEIQNEGQGHMNVVSPSWWCNRANLLRSVIGNYGILISTGGGTDFATSIQSQFWTCKNLQIIAIHDYSTNPNYVASKIDAAKPLAKANGKRMIYSEFGAMGANKQSQLAALTKTLTATGVPWLFWQILKPGQGNNNYEVWTNEPSWTTLASQSKLTRKHVGQFAWNEIDGDK